MLNSCTHSFSCARGRYNNELFNLPGYSQSDIQGLGIEHVRSRDPFILRAREAYLIKKRRILIPTKIGLIRNYSFVSVAVGQIFLFVSH